eukprot:gnl/MRDRNA2_/MRDRNA2_85265_c0_seq1.p1 gnl/MRDRNA2_/MRDRNA2_85265_c0~~gnl/MRDRNA2_/MRDRNA2_85265_c0_seq1.p1  ORF type:complete len:497 (-),score=59.03 gnl/MRDRNA2_/MRDRNA2_85265_c0_seq1:83-1426(-)
MDISSQESNYGQACTSSWKCVSVPYPFWKTCCHFCAPDPKCLMHHPPFSCFSKFRAWCDALEKEKKESSSSSKKDKGESREGGEMLTQEFDLEGYCEYLGDLSEIFVVSIEDAGAYAVIDTTIECEESIASFAQRRLSRQPKVRSVENSSGTISLVEGDAAEEGVEQKKGKKSLSFLIVKVTMVSGPGGLEGFSTFLDVLAKTIDAKLPNGTHMLTIPHEATVHLSPEQFLNITDTYEATVPQMMCKNTTAKATGKDLIPVGTQSMTPDSCKTACAPALYFTFESKHSLCYCILDETTMNPIYDPMYQLYSIGATTGKVPCPEATDTEGDAAPSPPPSLPDTPDTCASPVMLTVRPPRDKEIAGGISWSITHSDGGLVCDSTGEKYEPFKDVKSPCCLKPGETYTITCKSESGGWDGGFITYGNLKNLPLCVMFFFGESFDQSFTYE